MTAEKLHDAIGLLPSDLIAETDVKRSRKPKVVQWKEWAAMAASLALVIMLFRSGVLPDFGASSEAPMEAAAAPAAAAPQAIEDAAEEAAPPEEKSTAANGSGATPETGAADYDTAPAEAAASPNAPPALEVFCKDGAITVQSGNFTWSQEMDDGTTREVIACGAHPLDIIDMLPLLETPEMTVTLTWNLPPDTITAQCWHDENSEAESATIEGNTLHLKPGTYVYEVSAKWESGSGSFAFRVTAPES